jgi:3-dehydroquinate synthase
MNFSTSLSKSSQVAFTEDIYASQKFLSLCSTYDHIQIITDTNVGPLYANKLKNFLCRHTPNTHITSVPPGENSKSRETKAMIEDILFSHGCTRHTLLIALGGGVICDLTGFVAATYCRGIPVIYLPTSLLAMVDATIGGKTAINTPFGKNLLGTFTEPTAVFINILFLSTLPDTEYLPAFSEIIKHALVYDQDYFDFIEATVDALKARDFSLLKTIITRSIEIKSSVVKQDRQEKGFRQVLNFGHTIAHALEHASQYGISHGQAVTIGCQTEAFLSLHLGLLNITEYHKIIALLKHFVLPVPTPFPFSCETLKSMLIYDKKTRQHSPRFVMLNAIGDPFHHEEQYSHAINPKSVDCMLSHLLNYLHEIDYACSDY